MTASSSGLSVHELTTVEGVHRASRLFDEVWPGEPGTMPANILRALSHAGNYVAGVFDGDDLVGAAAGFFGAPSSRSLHSHIAGVAASHRGRGVGRLLKNHQREWALARGARYITWTFDPLVARNAHFNLNVLRGRASEYLEDHYGEMADEVNQGDATDRLLLVWDLVCTLSKQHADVDVVAEVLIPRDVESLRRESPMQAREWRLRVREALQSHLANGLVITGFNADRGYLLTEPSE